MLHTLTCLKQLRECIRWPGRNKEPGAGWEQRGARCKPNHLQRQLCSLRKPNPFPERGPA